MVLDSSSFGLLASPGWLQGDERPSTVVGRAMMVPESITASLTLTPASSTKQPNHTIRHQTNSDGNEREVNTASSNTSNDRTSFPRM